MNPKTDVISIIRELYPPHTRLYDILLYHGEQVANKALSAAKHVPDMDLDFIYEASMLHDIGIRAVSLPGLSSSAKAGEKLPYVCHGVEGRKILEERGLPRHGLVCERHVGVGISARDVEANNLPLPRRDMVPVTMEEKIISWADKFFSKKPEKIPEEKPVEKILAGLEKYGKDKADRFITWHTAFSGDKRIPCR